MYLYLSCVQLHLIELIILITLSFGQLLLIILFDAIAKMKMKIQKFNAGKFELLRYGKQQEIIYKSYDD